MAAAAHPAHATESAHAPTSRHPSEVEVGVLVRVPLVTVGVAQQRVCGETSVAVLRTTSAATADAAAGGLAFLLTFIILYIPGSRFNIEPPVYSRRFFLNAQRYGSILIETKGKISKITLFVHSQTTTLLATRAGHE